MLFGCWIAVLLLLLLLAGTQAQSGDGDTDMEPRISCTSHILTAGSSLSCKLVEGSDGEDDEDAEADGIEKMTVCYTDYSENKMKCLEALGDAVSSRDLSPVLHFNVTVHLKRGGSVTTTVDLKKIVKPRSPQVKNVTFDHESNQTVIRIQTPYHKEYLRLDNQLFQLLIWSTGSPITQNFSSDTLRIDMTHLQKHTNYHVKVRAIPVKGLQGTWSEWSEMFNFLTPAEKKAQKQTDKRQETYKLIVCLIILVVVPSSVVVFWKNKIFTYMWPNIPHPKHALVQICKPNKGLLLNFKPEVFSALKVEKTEEEERPCEETEPSIAAAAADGAQSTPRCSTQSSDCSRSTTSVSTEELEVSALLSRSSSDREDSLQSTSPSLVDVLRLGERPHTPQPERSSGGNEAEAYVTMSSFYQIK